MEINVGLVIFEEQDRFEIEGTELDRKSHPVGGIDSETRIGSREAGHEIGNIVELPCPEFLLYPWRKVCSCIAACWRVANSETRVVGMGKTLAKLC